jgi:ADP-heptose:LPS heptosyltransferase
MENALDQLRRGSRVAVIRLRSLGDCVLTTPALSILKQSRPDLEIAIVVEERFAPLFEGNPDLSAILKPSVKALAVWHPELCINLHGGTRSMVLTAGSLARLRAGFAHFRGEGIYNIRIPTAQEILGESRKVHTAEHLASAMFYLGARRIEIPRARLFAEPRPASPPYAVIHAVAALPEKAWRPEGFLAVAEHLKNGGLEPLFIGGPGDDLSAFTRFRTIVGAPLSETKSLLQNSSLFVGNDSGPAHMAAAFGVPVVVLFGTSDPTIWAPWRTQSEVIQADGPIASIPNERVLAAIETLRVAQ